MSVASTVAGLRPQEFRAIRDRLYGISGIDLQPGKEGLVQTRLAKRLRELGVPTFAGYLEYVEQDASGHELSHMVDLLTTNKTSFFRESHHFDLLRERVLPPLFTGADPIRIWSAGCSSGEEPYTISAIIDDVEQAAGKRDVKILATDLSSRVLTRARDAVYDEAMLEGLDRPTRQRMFEPFDGGPGRWRVRASLRARVSFARLNLMKEWPMKGRFQVIFCRNVMIYFDRPTQERLIQRFHGMLCDGGHLFIGHSESLTGMCHGFSYVAPAAYVK
jgi:chemotaxis protein methyltransferase CheR